MTLHNLALRAGKLASDNSPLILTAFSVVGTVSTTLLTVKASFRSAHILIEDQAERDRQNTRAGELRYPELTAKEEFLLIWKEYIPPAVVLVGTVACIVCVNRIGTKRAAALAAAYSLSERAYVEYKDKVVEQLGKTKEQRVRDEIAQDRMDVDKLGNQEIFATGGGTELCYEKFTGRYFWSSMETIKYAVNRLNHKVNSHYEASLNDFYDYLGLDHNTIGEELGWNTDKLLDVSFSTTLADGNRPCLVFDYMAEPRRGYFRYA